MNYSIAFTTLVVACSVVLAFDSRHEGDWPQDSILVSEEAQILPQLQESQSSSFAPPCSNEAWFDLTPRPFSMDCSGNSVIPACLPLGMSDVNGDGMPDLFSAQSGVIYQK
jgi:hypothetical protein